MRKRFEEELSKLAFGDLDAEEAQRLSMRAMNDPEASKTFQTYCRMKEELRSLGENVPADQLSKERLREAILSRGMKDHLPQTNAKPNWIWMPAMAAALAFGVMFVKGQMPFGGKPASTVVVDQSTPEKSGGFDVNPIVKPEPVIAAQNHKPLVKDKPEMHVASNYGRTSRSDRFNDPSASRALNGSGELPDGVPKLDLLSEPKESGPIAQPISFPSGEMSEPKRDAGMTLTSPPTSSVPGSMSRGAPAPAPTLVVIQPETDAETGTLKAKEVSSNSNVVVGG